MVKGELGDLNQHANREVLGEMFLLKISDTKDERGQRFYVDAKPSANRKETDDFEDEIGSLSFLEYYGAQEFGARFPSLHTPSRWDLTASTTHPSPHPTLHDGHAPPQGLSPSLKTEWDKV